MTASSRNNYLAYTVLLAAHIALVWLLLPYFSSQDGPSHVYNLAILHDLLNGGKEWGAYFSARLHAMPNLGFNLVAYPLLKFLPSLVVEKTVITFYLILMAISVPVTFLETILRKIKANKLAAFSVCRLVERKSET